MYKFLFALIFISAFIACNNNSDNSNSGDTTISGGNNLPVPQPIIFTVDSVYPHDKEAFTQGLEFYKGSLLEGTGEPEKSSLRLVNIKTGVPEKKYVITDPEIFGEGITVFNKKIYQLTWQNHKIFVYNVDDIYKPIETLNWKYEGWGITNDGTNLIISDGSDKLYYTLPNDSLKETKISRIVSVADNRGMVDSLNELEYINGYVYANRWYNNEIVKIDPANGHVIGKIDFSGLLQQYAPKESVEESAVLNGIAYDSVTKKLYITGKDWPKMFLVHLN